MDEDFKTKELTLELGNGLDVDGLLEALEDRTDELAAFLIRDVSHHKARATYSDGTFGLENVEIDSIEEGKYYLHYCYGWEAWWGCKNLNAGDTSYNAHEFIYKDGEATFLMNVFGDRDTFEEF